MAATKRKTTKLIIPENIVFETPKYYLVPHNKSIIPVTGINFERTYDYSDKEVIRYSFMLNDRAFDVSWSSDPERYKQSEIFTSLRDSKEELIKEILEKASDKIDTSKLRIIQATKELANLKADLEQEEAQYVILTGKYK